ncbi:MAG: transglutaminase family protein, partial [Rhodoferax sp.]
MIRLRLAIQLHYQVQPPGGDFVFHLHAAFTPRQRVVAESLHFSQPLAYTLESSPPSPNRILRASALPGMLQVAYAATVDLDHWVASPATIAE